MPKARPDRVWLGELDASAILAGSERGMELGYILITQINEARLKMNTQMTFTASLCQPFWEGAGI